MRPKAGINHVKFPVARIPTLKRDNAVKVPPAAFGGPDYLAPSGFRGSIQVGPQPAFRFGQRHPAPRGVVFKLVTADPGDAEVLAFGVREVEA